LPCATWAFIRSRVAPGNAVIARAGTWTTNANYGIANGTSSGIILYMGYPGELPVIDHASGSWYGFQGNGTYTTIDGFKLQNTPCPAPSCASGWGIDVSGTQQITNLTIRNTEVRDYYDALVAVASQQNTLIERNVFHDDLGEHNIYEGNNSACASPQTSTITVRYNILYNAVRDNFHFNGICTGCLLDSNIIYSANMSPGGGSANISLQNGWNHSTVQNNVVFNASGYPFLFNPYGGNGNSTIHGADSNYNLIVNNTFVHTGRDSSGQDESGNGFGPVAAINSNIATSTMTTTLGSNVITLPSETEYVYANVGDTAVGTGIPSDRTVTGGTGGTGYTLTLSQNATATGGPGVPVTFYHAWDIGHNTWANNILMEVGNSTNSGGNAVRYQRITPDYDWLTTDTWTNNIIYISNSASPLGDGLAVNYHVPQYNWAYFGSNAGVFTNNTQSNPLLAAVNAAWYNTPEAWNLRPGSGSPAIGTGTATGAPATDIQGNARSGSMDIGAYAASTSTAPPTVSHCDLNNDGVVNILDVTIAVAQTLGLQPCASADLVGNGMCTVVDVQRVVTAAQGGTCLYH
jgi:hypothetical protein